MDVPVLLLHSILLAFNGIQPLTPIDICRTEKCLKKCVDCKASWFTYVCILLL